MGKYGIGAIGNPGTNSRGGIDWGYESIVNPAGGIVNDESFAIITADAIRLNQPPPSNIYGFQYTPTTGGNINNSIVADVDYDTESQDKSVYGDVDIYKIPEVPLGYDLALIKTLSAGQPAGVQVGDNASFTIQVVNQAASESLAFTVTDMIPSGLSFVSATGTNFSCSASGQLVTCDYTGSLQPGDIATFDLVVSVDDMSQAPFRNWAEIESDSGDDDDSQPGDNDANDSGAGTGSNGGDPVENHNDLNHSGANNDPLTDEDDSDYEDLFEESYDLALIKTRVYGSGAVSVGSSVYFEVEILNQGNIAASTFSFLESIPAGLELAYVYSSPYTCEDSGGTPLQWTVSPAIQGPAPITCNYTETTPLAPGVTAMVRFRFVVTDLTMQPLRNWAEIETDDGDDVDSDPGDNDASDGAAGTGTPGNDPVINHNDIDHDDPAYDENTEDEDDSDYEEVSGTYYDLALIKELSAGQSPNVSIGSTVNYTITVKNQGNQTAQNFSVTDMIPAGMSFVTATPAPDGSPPAGTTGQLTWTIATALFSGNTTTINLQLKVDDASQAQYRNWAEIESDNGDDVDSDPGDNNGNDGGAGDGGTGGDPVVNHNDINHDETTPDKFDEDDSDYEDVFLIETYDLALIKELAAGQTTPVTPGSNVNYTITIQNQGTAVSGAYSVTDMIPAGMSYVSSSPAADGPPAAGATGLLTWTFPASSELAAGAQQTIQLTLKIDDHTQAPFRNWAEIETDSGTDEDSDPGDNNGNDSGSGTGGNGSDPVDNHNDITIDEPAGDEDDSDYEDVDVTIDYDLALHRNS